MSLFSELSQIKRILPSFTNYRIVSEECAGKKSHSHQLLNDHHQTGQSLFAQLQKQQPAEDDGSDNHHLINSKDPEVKNGFLRAAFRKGSYNCFFFSHFLKKKNAAAVPSCIYARAGV